MQLKHSVLLLIAVSYTSYYVGVSKGLISKEVQYGNEDQERTSMQKVVDVITPDSPTEKRLRKQDDLDELNLQLDLAKKNYESYDNWLTESIKNPPLCEAGREQMRAELQNDKRPEMKARIEKLELQINDITEK